MSHDSYESPLAGRYASSEMKKLWSERTKITTWRRLWIELARAQKQLGGLITDEQISQMESKVGEIDWEREAAIEKKNRHDVVAHIQAFGEVCPLAKPIIHQASTSCYVTDNTDLIQIKEGLRLVCVGLARVIARLRGFAQERRMLPTLGFTHLQPAQPVTVGKRAAMWLLDLLLSLRALEAQRDGLMFLGAKGTTGTQDAYLKYFHGDHGLVKQMDRLITKAFGFSRSVPVSGQNYTRQIDSMVLFSLSNFAAAAYKIGDDVRLLQSMKELEEPFEKDQVGSSAMAYKRNPMRAERVCALARVLKNQVEVALETHATQWLERTLDDSAARRLYLSESFLLADAIVRILQNIFEGLIVNTGVIRRHLENELPFLMSEEILIAMVESGADRQECHEKLRQHAQKAGDQVKELGADNDLLERIRQDPYFRPVCDRLSSLLDPARFIGRSPELVEEFLPEVDQALKPYQDQLGERSELRV